MEKKGIFLEITDDHSAELNINGNFPDLTAALAMALIDNKSHLRDVVVTAIQFLKESEGIDIFALSDKKEK